jgi:hypothetical protein
VKETTMSMTVSDITRDADLFRRAYPNWPHPEPEEAPVTLKTGDTVLVRVPGRTDLRPVVVASVSPSGEYFEGTDGYGYPVPVSGTEAAA